MYNIYTYILHMRTYARARVIGQPAEPARTDVIAGRLAGQMHRDIDDRS